MSLKDLLTQKLTRYRSRSVTHVESLEVAEKQSSSIEERLTRNLALRVSRRGFLKGLGTSIAGIGLSLARIGVNPVQAEACCLTPACSGCTAQGSICPSGCYEESHTACCLNYCRWTYKKCVANQCAGGCYCCHDDLASCPGGTCGSMPTP
jgi:hypothetical protein